MQEIRVFNNATFGELRSVLRDGEPWFVAADACRALEISNPSGTMQRLDEDEKGVVLIETLGGKQNVRVVNEPGLYSLILRSRKPEAKVFQRWVTHEVLPSIRRHGAYISHNTLEEMLISPDFGIRLLSELKQERSQRTALEAHAQRQAAQIRTLAPKAGYCDLILQNDALLPITIIAKDYGLTARAMNALLQELGVQYRVGDEWVLYHRYAGQGYAHSTTEITNGGKAVTFTCWTQKGRRFIYELLKAERGLVPMIERAVASSAEACYE